VIDEMTRRLPNFLFIGADKAGSTWLFNALRQHPDCFVPACKDIYFFDRYYDRGLEWYASFFDAAPDDAVAVGELSHDYLYSDAAAERIARDLPGVKLVVFLRDPVSRAFSEYLYLVRSGLTRDLGVRAAFTKDGKAIEHSRYARHLPRYLERFPEGQIGIFYYDLLEQQPTELARRVFAFLGMQPLAGVDYDARVLGAARPRSRAFARAARAGANVARTLGFPTIVGRVKSSRVTKVLYAEYGEEERPRPSEEESDWLHGLLDPDLADLERLLGTSFEHWALARPQRP
jgi:hypothetical protein